MKVVCYFQSNPNPVSSSAGPSPIDSMASSESGWIYVETSGTFNSPIIVGEVGLLRSIVQSGSIFSKVTM